LPVRVIHDHDALRFHFVGSATSTFDSAKTIDHNDVEAMIRKLIDS